MINQIQFKQIKNEKKRGRNINQTAQYLRLSYPTVKKYWEMEEEAFLEYMQRDKDQKSSSLTDDYDFEIVEMLRDIPEASSAMIYDRLEEKEGKKLKFSERSLRRKVNQLRIQYDIPKQEKRRDYQAVEELEPGEQAQADFGECWLRLEKDPSKQKKLYFFIITLKYSRYKYVEWQDRPFTAETAVKAHQNAFEYFQGIPRTIVYDQDSVFVSSENKGAIRFTHAFEAFEMSMPFKIYVARGADPETKGAVERYVRFVKENFARKRLYKDLEQLNEECRNWLERTGNGKICQATKQTPVKRFEIEKQALLKIDESDLDSSSDTILTRTLNKDNTIQFKGNRYRVPNGTYNQISSHKVGIKVKGEILEIFDLESTETLIRHPLCREKARLVGEKEVKTFSQHTREQLARASGYLMNYEGGLEFFRSVCENYERYIPEQMQEIIEAFELDQPKSARAVEAGLRYCIDNSLNSATDLREALQYFNQEEEKEKLSLQKIDLHNQVKELNASQLKRLEIKLQSLFNDPKLSKESLAREVSRTIEKIKAEAQAINDKSTLLDEDRFARLKEQRLQELKDLSDF